MTLHRRWAVLLVIALSGCAVMPSVQDSPRRVADPSLVMPGLEQRIAALVSEARQRIAAGTRPLTLDPELVAVARAKSADMAARHSAAHLSPGGQTAALMLMARDAAFHGILGEDLAEQPYLPEYGVEVDTFAHRIVDTWLASKAHRESLSDPHYVRTGVGAAVSGEAVYVTALFAGP